MNRPALLARFPSPVRKRPGLDEPWPGDAYSSPLPAGADETYPALAEDFRLWHDVVAPRFRRADHLAQTLQHRFWRQQVTLILGGLVATVVGACQAVAGGGNVPLAVVGAVVTGLLTGVAALARARNAQQGYLTARLRAERMKSEFLLFLARTGEYHDDDRVTVLRRQVDEISGPGDAA